MKIDSSFDTAFLQLQNGVNKAAKAASEVLNAVGSEGTKAVEVAASEKSADRTASGGVDVSA